MLGVNVIFEEKILSETVVEYKCTSSNYAASKRPLRRISIFLLAFVMTAYVVGMISVLTFASFCSLLAICGVTARYTTVEESVIIIQNFGIQLRRRTLIASETTEFLENDRIDGVLIHEYISGSQVRFCLAFLVKGEKRMSLIFKHLYPGFDALRRVYVNSK